MTVISPPHPLPIVTGTGAVPRPPPAAGGSDRAVQRPEKSGGVLAAAVIASSINAKRPNTFSNRAISRAITSLLAISHLINRVDDSSR